MFDKSALDACLSGLAQHKQLAGVSACIMGPEGPVYDWHFGVRDAAGLLVPDSDTMFGIASMSKSITSLCLCILESEGRLRLDDPVCRYLPAFRVPGQPPEAVTLWHLMNHTSGIPPMEPLEWSIAMNTPGRDDDEETLRLLCEHAKKLGDLIAYKVIPRPHDEVAHVMTGMAKYFEPAEEE